MMTAYRKRDMFVQLMISHVSFFLWGDFQSHTFIIIYTIVWAFEENIMEVVYKSRKLAVCALNYVNHNNDDCLC